MKKTNTSACAILHDAALPSMAWFLSRRSGSVEITCGDAVDSKGSSIFEGAWSGPFEEFDFQNARTLLGSGVIVRTDSIVLVPPSHVLECIYCLRVGKDLFASNSLAFLLTRLELEPNVDLHFGKRMHTLSIRGIKSYDREVIQTSSGPVERCAFNNWVIDDSGELRIEAKQTNFEFTDFDSYHTAVLGEMRSILENANSESRQRKFRFVSSISSGYDSPVGAVLSSQLGCTEGVTLVNARGGANDSGEEIGKVLGLKMSMYERPERVLGSGCPEAEFIATGMGGEDFAYQGFEPVLKNAIYVTGFLGSNWQTDITPNVEIIRFDSSGSGLSEFRLRTCFIHFPVPFIGALELADIREVSNRDEMAPWTLDSGYDRPIPRRIIESAGIPRAAFGQFKKATSVLFHKDKTLFSDEFNGRVDARVRKEAGIGYTFCMWRYTTREKIYWKLRLTAQRMKRLRLGFLTGFFEQCAIRFIGNYELFFHDHPRTYFEFRTSLEILASRYERTKGTS